ncbi:MAG: hypothetical protein OXC62_05140 [Aestuariivita sp.]|nr:hypothetical protein [Aestuariivita sp.]
MKRLTTSLAVALMTMAAPARAQILPTAEFGPANPVSLTNNCSGNTCPEDSTNRYGHCLSQFGLRLRPAPTQNTEVRVLTVTRSGHRRFYDYGVDVYMDDPADPIRSSTTVTINAGNSSYAGLQTNNPVCWADDHLVTGDSEIEVVIVGGAGYQVNPAANSFTVTITEDDDCANPGDHTVYVPIGGNMNNTCKCITKAKFIADSGESESYLKSAHKWRTYSTNYCAESPYQGPDDLD